MNDQLLFGVAVVPAIIGLTQLTKEIGIPGRFAPLVAVVFGVLAALAQVYSGQWPWIPAVVLGVSLGLSAVGLYSTTVTLTKPSDPTVPAQSLAPSTTQEFAGTPPQARVSFEPPAAAVPVPDTVIVHAPATPETPPSPLVSSSGAPLH